MSVSLRDELRLDVVSLGESYRTGEILPSDIVKLAYRRIAEDSDNPIWTSLRPLDEVLEDAHRLEATGDDGEHGYRLPLFGIPFAIKDNIDVEGMPTTAGGLTTDRVASSDAPVVGRLRAAGAIPLGKTNLDQFATGLTGSRSRFGICRNAIDCDYISGGSSSGSAVAVAAGHVSFALGTDTAGSGRIPAALNNLVGLKPTRGLISTRGVIPACRTLDCVSIFALNCSDAHSVFAVASGYDNDDPFSRMGRVQRSPARVQLNAGILSDRDAEFFGDDEAGALYADAVARLEKLGARLIEIDFSPFREAGELLYEGPWLAERLNALRQFLGAGIGHAQLHPVVQQVLEPGSRFSAGDVFEGYYRLLALRRLTMREWRKVDVLALPTAATIYTVEQVLADPIETNRRLGLYTNFVNLLDLCAVAVPAASRRNGLPFGISLIAPSLHDDWLCSLGTRLEGL